MVQSVVCEVWMVLVVCIKLDGVRWAGSIVHTMLAQQDLTVFRVCVDIAHPPHRGKVSCQPLPLSILLIACILYMHILYMQERTKSKNIHIIYHIYLSVTM